MTREGPTRISQEFLAELFEEIRDKLESHEEKLDYIIDHLPTVHSHSHSYDSNLNDD